MHFRLIPAISHSSLNLLLQDLGPQPASLQQLGAHRLHRQPFQLHTVKFWFLLSQDLAEHGADPWFSPCDKCFALKEAVGEEGNEEG